MSPSRWRRARWGLAAAFLGLAVYAAQDDGRTLRWVDGRAERHADGARSPGMDRFMELVSELGSNKVVFVCSAALALLALARGRRPLAALVVVATLLRPAVEWFVKDVVARPRPEEIDPLLPANGYSFPSGHVMATIILWWLTATVLGGWSSPSRRRALVLAGVVVSTAVATSRVYLGLHHLSDVVGSFVLAPLILLAAVWAVGTAMGEEPGRVNQTRCTSPPELR